jgi:hypothetical protein
MQLVGEEGEKRSGDEILLIRKREMIVTDDMGTKGK